MNEITLRFIGDKLKQVDREIERMRADVAFNLEAVEQLRSQLAHAEVLQKDLAGMLSKDS